MYWLTTTYDTFMVYIYVRYVDGPAIANPFDAGHILAHIKHGPGPTYASNSEPRNLPPPKCYQIRFHQFVVQKWTTN